MSKKKRNVVSFTPLCLDTCRHRLSRIKLFKSQKPIVLLWCYVGKDSRRTKQEMLYDEPRWYQVTIEIGNEKMQGYPFTII